MPLLDPFSLLPLYDTAAPGPASGPPPLPLPPTTPATPPLPTLAALPPLPSSTAAPLARADADPLDPPFFSVFDTEVALGEGSTADLLRPLLRAWLSDNMPRIVEQALRIEMAKSMQKPPK